MGTQRFDTVVVGGGQAGLAVGYHLARRGRSFVVLDENDRVGDAWRRRWDSLHLFTNAWAVGLPGTRYPGPRLGFPSKDEYADYLEAYAERWALPVRTGARVTRVRAGSDGAFVVTLDDDEIEADHVVVTTGASHVPLGTRARRRAGPEDRPAALVRLPEPRRGARGARCSWWVPATPARSSRSSWPARGRCSWRGPTRTRSPCR